MIRTLSDDDLHELLQAADPLAGAPPRPAAATEDALARLLALSPRAAAPSRTGPRTPRRQARRWWALRLAPLAATAAAAVAALSALPSSGPVAVSAASAKVILARAAAAVAGSDGAILHADITATQTWQQGGASEQWTEQDWQQVSSPYDERTIDSGIWPTVVEMAYVKGSMWLYDPSTDTIYTNDPPPAFTLTPASQPGTYTLRPAGNDTSGPSLTVNSAQADALRAGTDVWASNGSGGLLVIPRPTSGPQSLSDFRPQALALLHSATAQVTDNVTIDGQTAIEVSSADGATTYYLNPSSYAPIQLTRTIGPGNDLGDPGNDGTVTLRFSDWQYLTGTAADPALLSLTAQHPSASVDNSAADYTAAEKRLFP